MAKEYRSRSRIVLDLMRALREEKETGVTRLLFRANLSHERLAGYLEEVEAKGWVAQREESGRRVWALTDEGRSVLLELERIVRFMDDFGLGL